MDKVKVMGKGSWKNIMGISPVKGLGINRRSFNMQRGTCSYAPESFSLSLFTL
jgi:hypothetical protein